MDLYGVEGKDFFLFRATPYDNLSPVMCRLFHHWYYVYHCRLHVRVMEIVTFANCLVISEFITVAALSSILWYDTCLLFDTFVFIPKIISFIFYIVRSVHYRQLIHYSKPTKWTKLFLRLFCILTKKCIIIWFDFLFIL